MSPRLLKLLDTIFEEPVLEEEWTTLEMKPFSLVPPFGFPRMGRRALPNFQESWLYPQNPEPSDEDGVFPGSDKLMINVDFDEDTVFSGFSDEDECEKDIPKKVGGKFNLNATGKSISCPNIYMEISEDYQEDDAHKKVSRNQNIDLDESFSSKSSFQLHVLSNPFASPYPGTLLEEGLDDSFLEELKMKYMIREEEESLVYSKLHPNFHPMLLKRVLFSKNTENLDKIADLTSFVRIPNLGSFGKSVSTPNLLPDYDADLLESKRNVSKSTGQLHGIKEEAMTFYFAQDDHSTSKEIGAPIASSTPFTSPISRGRLQLKTKWSPLPFDATDEGFGETPSDNAPLVSSPSIAANSGHSDLIKEEERALVSADDGLGDKTPDKDNQKMFNSFSFEDLHIPDTHFDHNQSFP